MWDCYPFQYGMLTQECYSLLLWSLLWKNKRWAFRGLRIRFGQTGEPLLWRISVFSDGNCRGKKSLIASFKWDVKLNSSVVCVKVRLICCFFHWNIVYFHGEEERTPPGYVLLRRWKDSDSVKVSFSSVCSKYSDGCYSEYSKAAFAECYPKA